MAIAMVSATSLIPCRRRRKCTGAVVIEALALLAMVLVMPGAAPSFLPSTAQIRSRQAQSQQAGRVLHREVFARSRKALETRGRSRVPLLAVSSSMTVAELKDLCKEKGLSATGKKAELVERLKAAPAPVPAAKAKDADDSRKPGQILPGDRAMARYHRDNEMYPGIVLEEQEDGRYLISWDEPDENEPLTSCSHVQFLKPAKQRLESGTKQIYHVGDKVSARFPADNKWYQATLIELNGDKCKVKWFDPDGSPPIAEMPVGDMKLVLRIKSAC